MADNVGGKSEGPSRIGGFDMTFKSARFAPVWAAALMASMPLGASASNWISIGGAEKLKVYIDTESISPRGKLVKAWVVYDYQDDQFDIGVTKNSGKYKSVKSLELYDCTERTTGNLLGLYFRWLGVSL